MAAVNCRTIVHCSLLNLILIYILYLSFIFYVGSFKNEEQVLEMLQGSRDCIMDSITDMDADEMWLKTPGIVNTCSHVRLLNLKGYSNLDEIKYHVVRKSQNKDCAIISLGIGRDVGAELQMKEDEPRCRFFGADPVKEFNKELYSGFGTFFHTAVGAKNGTYNAAILDTKTWDYFNKTVPFRNFYSFIQEDVKINHIDQLMIDVEYTEYDLFPLLLKHKRPTDMVFCQMNIEIHMGPYNRRKQFQDFINQLLDEGEYVPLKAATMLGHIRLYLLNFNDEECRQRFIDNEED